MNDRENPYGWLDPAEPFSALVVADRLEEAGLAVAAEALRAGRIDPHRWYGFGDGSGDGSGAEYGARYEDGEGLGCGVGDGYGYGYGSGSGDGYGSGSGDGPGGGDGYQSPECVFPRRLSVNDLASGKNYMICIGDGWMFAGRFVRPSGLFGAVFDHVSNLCRTGGASWADLCRGQGRGAMTTQAYLGEVVFSRILFAVEWAGDLPA